MPKKVRRKVAEVYHEREEKTFLETVGDILGGLFGLAVIIFVISLFVG